MKNAINFDLADTGKPKYQLMVERLESAIAAGQWSVGERLPSNRELATLFGVTIGTVSKAMSEAVRRGIVDTRVGSGTYIRAPRHASDGAPGAPSLDLSLNVLPLAPVQALLQQALAAHAQSQGAHRLFAYEEVQQRQRFRHSAATWLGAMGTPTEAQQVVITGGVHHALVAAFHTQLRPGDTALCDTLCYTGFQRLARLRGVRLVGVASDAEGMRPDSLERALRESGAQVLVAHPVLQNPTATLMPLARRERIAALCRQHGLRVIEDAVNVPLADPGTPSLATLLPERTLHLTGFSKTIASGFRLGYASMPAAWVDAFQDAALGVQWFAPGFYAELLEVMRAEGLLDACMQAHRAEAATRQQLLREAVPQAVVGGAGYHAWLPCGPERSSTELCDEARRAGVSLSAAHHFCADPGAEAPDGVRISLGWEDRSQLASGLSTLAGLLRTEAYRGAVGAPAV